mmetsp:Transcript_4730/g.10654  ORF Transcript_4730/g.10654 Transcript_4730/m.10654 type:complete len:89 (-) Transcript_4730:6-272(-)
MGPKAEVTKERDQGRERTGFFSRPGDERHPTGRDYFPTIAKQQTPNPQEMVWEWTLSKAQGSKEGLQGSRKWFLCGYYDNNLINAFAV